MFGSPMDYLRERANRWRAHPFQQGAGLLAGMFGGPAAGMGAQALFNRYNQGQFNDAANQANQNLGGQIDQTSRNIWDKPVDGPLGQVSGGDSGRDQQNQQLGQALNGGYSGPTQGMFQNNYGNNYGQGVPGGNGQGWTQAGNPGGLLDFLGPNSGTPGETQRERVLNHLEAKQNGGGIGPPALYGVSNFMVGGAPVINGVRPAGYDPNQGAMARRFFGG